MEEHKKPDKAHLSAEVRALYGPIYSVLMTAQADAWRDLKLTMSQFKILAAISSVGTVDSPRLLKHLGILPSALTRTVDGLVARGLVLRSERPPDRRIVYLTCTEKGTALVRSLTDFASSGILAAATERMSADDLCELRNGLLALSRALAEVPESGEPGEALPETMDPAWVQGQIGGQ